MGNNGELDCTTNFADQIGELFLKPDASDVTFIINNDSIPAHKCILAARYSYFRSLLFGALSDPTTKEFNLTDSLETYQIIQNPVETFKSLLQFIYTGRLSLNRLTSTAVLELFRLADAFCIDDLKSLIPSYLRSNVSLENCCAILDTAFVFDLPSLKAAALIFMFQNTIEVLHHVDFKTMSPMALCFLLEHGSFYAPEAEMLRSILGWYECNQGADIETVISHIRFGTLGETEIETIVKEFSIENLDHLLDVVRKQATIKDVRCYVPMKPETNFASPDFNAKTISGDNPSELLVKNSGNGTSHLITGKDDGCIVVELGTVCIINHLKLQLPNRSYAYYVEVSLNHRNWERVVDFTKHICRSQQTLFFEPRSIRYIKLVGDNSNLFDCEVYKEFCVLNLESYYTSSPPALMKGFVSPTRNVAKIEQGARVIEGQCDSVHDNRNVIFNYTPDRLLNRDFTNHSVYACHRIGDGSIVVQLGQPFYIGSLSLSLWVVGGRTNSFYIETSTDKKNWQMAVDKRIVCLTSSVHFTFEPRVVVFIRIVGVVHVIYFQTP